MAVYAHIIFGQRSYIIGFFISLGWHIISPENAGSPYTWQPRVFQIDEQGEGGAYAWGLGWFDERASYVENGKTETAYAAYIKQEFKHLIFVYLVGEKIMQNKNN